MQLKIKKTIKIIISIDIRNKILYYKSAAEKCEKMSAIWRHIWGRMDKQN